VSQCWLMSELGLAQKRGDEYSKRLLLDGGNALVIENRLYLRRLLVLDLECVSVFTILGQFVETVNMWCHCLK
jgi:hypothetical protein